MEKIAVDPRAVSTPIGAVLGLLLVRKAYGDKVTMNQQVAGAGIGGAGGYIAGSYMQSAPFGLRPTDDPKLAAARLRKHVLSNPDGIEITPEVIKLADSIRPHIPGNIDMDNINNRKYVDPRGKALTNQLIAKIYGDNAEINPNYGQSAKKHAEEGDSALKGISQQRSRFGAFNK